MVRTITPLQEIPSLKISFAKGKSVTNYVPIQATKPDGRDVGELILPAEDAIAYGFRKETTKGGATRYSLPLQINTEFASALMDVAEALGDESYSPTYSNNEGYMVYARVIMSNGGVVFSNIYVLSVEATIKVDTVCFRDIPKMQLSLIEARVKDTEMVREKLL